jgi:hypothetical protein
MNYVINRIPIGITSVAVNNLSISLIDIPTKTVYIRSTANYSEYTIRQDTITIQDIYDRKIIVAEE